MKNNFTSMENRYRELLRQFDSEMMEMKLRESQYLKSLKDAKKSSGVAARNRQILMSTLRSNREIQTILKNDVHEGDDELQKLHDLLSTLRRVTSSNATTHTAETDAVKLKELKQKIDEQIDLVGVDTMRLGERESSLKSRSEQSSALANSTAVENLTSFLLWADLWLPLSLWLRDEADWHADACKTSASLGRVEEHLSYDTMSADIERLMKENTATATATASRESIQQFRSQLLLQREGLLEEIDRAEAGRRRLESMRRLRTRDLRALAAALDVDIRTATGATVMLTERLASSSFDTSTPLSLPIASASPKSHVHPHRTGSTMTSAWLETIRRREGSGSGGGGGQGHMVTYGASQGQGMLSTEHSMTGTGTGMAVAAARSSLSTPLALRPVAELFLETVQPGEGDHSAMYTACALLDGLALRRAVKRIQKGISVLLCGSGSESESRIEQHRNSNSKNDNVSSTTDETVGLHDLQCVCMEFQQLLRFISAPVENPSATRSRDLSLRPPPPALPSPLMKDEATAALPYSYREPVYSKRSPIRDLLPIHRTFSAKFSFNIDDPERQTKIANAALLAKMAASGRRTQTQSLLSPTAKQRQSDHVHSGLSGRVERVLTGEYADTLLLLICTRRMGVGRAGRGRPCLVQMTIPRIPLENSEDLLEITLKARGGVPKFFIKGMDVEETINDFAMKVDVKTMRDVLEVDADTTIRRLLYGERPLVRLPLLTQLLKCIRLEPMSKKAVRRIFREVEKQGVEADVRKVIAGVDLQKGSDVDAIDVLTLRSRDGAILLLAPSLTPPSSAEESSEEDDSDDDDDDEDDDEEEDDEDDAEDVEDEEEEEEDQGGGGDESGGGGGGGGGGEPDAADDEEDNEDEDDEGDEDEDDDDDE
eukprot:gene3503-6971_t